MTEKTTAIRASSLHRYRICSGAPFAERHCPDATERSWTHDGTLIHEALLDPAKLPDLRLDLADVVEQMQETADWLVDKIFPQEEGIERLELIREKPFAVTWKGKCIITGHPDFVQIGTIYGLRTALILDFKSGYLDVPLPELNDQLRAYAVMIWQDAELKIDQVFACIVPRWRRTPAPVHYSSADLPLALADVIEVWRASQVETAPRRPSVEACRYCRARATSFCVETLMPPKELQTMPDLINLSPKQKGDLLVLCDIVAGNIKALRERLFEELKENEGAVEGWQIVPGDFRASIPDPSAAFQVVSAWLTGDEFQKCLTVRKSDLEAELKATLYVKESIKGKAAKQRIEEILSPVIVKKQGESKLERKP
jgi:hypothetical protein